ncbi:hypothetical protein ACHWQZ_G013614 [Mnemiopsis leidyi]
MVNETLNRVCVRPDQGNENDSPMSKPSSTPKDAVKTPEALKDKKGTVSITVSKNVLKQKKVKAQKPGDFVAPKFDIIDNTHCCVKCKKGNHLTDSIVCQLCNSSFHALCKSKAGGTVDNSAICTPTFLTSVRPVIAKYGTNANRWGNFMFVCAKCNDHLKAFMNSKTSTRRTADSGVNTEPTENIHASKTPNMLLSSDEEDKTGKHEKLITEVIDQVQVILKGFENGFLSRVDTMLDEKLSTKSSDSSYSLTSRRAPTPSSSSGVSSISSFEPDLNYEHSFSTPHIVPGYSNVLRMTTPSKAALQPSLKENAVTTKSATEKKIESMRKNIVDESSLQKNSISNVTEDSQNIIVLRMDKTNRSNLIDTKQSASKILKSVPVINMKENVRDNKLVIQLPSSKDKQLAKELLSKSSMVQTSNILVDDTKKMLPKITVANIPNYILTDIKPNSNMSILNSQTREKIKSVLKQGFMDKNEKLRKLVVEENKTFDIVFVKTGYNYTTAGIKVSPIVRKLLLDQGFVYIADTRSKVFDRLDLKQCFKCQKLGHISTDCHDQGVTCMYCGASHRTGACPQKVNREKHRCVNCSHSEDETLRSNCHTHHSGEESCPIIMKALDRLRCNTEYSKNI